MQYTLVNEKDLAKFKLPCYSEIKYDGLFADTFVSESCVEQSSRSGETLNIPLTEKTKQGLQSEFAGSVLHGEGLVLNDDGSFMNRQEGNGILNSSEASNYKSMMVFWDCVTLEEYKAKVSTRPYSERRKFLEEKILKLKEQGCLVDVSDVRICETVEDIISHFIEARNKGEEGTVIKEFSLPWAIIITTTRDFQ
jgi:ATP-dependent DNA ligase